MNIRIIIAAIIVAVLIATIGFIWKLSKDNESLCSYRDAYRLLEKESVEFEKKATASSVISSDIKSLLEDNKAISSEIKAMEIKLNKVNGYSSFGTRFGSSVTGKMKEDSSGKKFELKEKDRSIEVRYDPKNDSITIKDSVFADFTIVYYHKRKKFLGVGIGKKVFETTIVSNNPNIVIGKIVSFQSKFK